MPQQIIIDGYNVIYTDDSLRRVAIKDLERARRLFVERLKSYATGRQVRITVVFDGRGGLIEAEPVIPGKLQVVFSDSGQTADQVIVTTLEQSGNARAYIVVTSDMADIGGRARGLGARLVRSKAFLERIAGARPVESASDEGDYGDTDYWLDKFTKGED